ncbi:hypothetical protein FN846DRAFT_1022281 [Sphaerosporella brunnea]|uniref:Uncharacterized protein n=1 Tax=Sphaerosporella brunnea TaxID=1250544 RepID=A0A5J5EV25_9PEZI|nr:hypothetical protein FN846DRAFT_1022281 [Sphaerosporella brunnea]
MADSMIPIDPNLELVAVADPPPTPIKSEDEDPVDNVEDAKEAQRLRKNFLSSLAYARKKAQREKAADRSKALTDLTIKYEQDKEEWLSEREVLLAYINHLQNLLVQT